MKHGCKYNIMTVLNHDYMPFGVLFMNSLFDHVDYENIDQIFVFDTGLTREDKLYLSFFPKVVIHATEFKTSHREMHDKDWCDNVYSKTKFLLETLKSTSTPTIMIDSDSVFISDFFDLVDPSKDFQACKRQNQRAGFSSHIGSFFVVNNVEKSAEFMNSWIKEINNGEEKHKESPALSRLVESGVFDVGDIPEELVSYFSFENESPQENTRILHLKSDYGRETVEKRIATVRPLAQTYFR
tara:strand:+ start:9115 stop:9837 length:723 start_codon:yes stop_codon:yes gene_type:complete